MAWERGHARETLMVLDVVETIRAENKGSQAREDLVDRVRSVYEAQGELVDDETISAALERMDDTQMAFVPPSAKIATVGRIWMARRRISTWTLGIAAGLFLALWVPPQVHRVFIEEPRLLREAEQHRIITIELPAQLDAALAQARNAAGESAAMLSRIDQLEGLGHVALSRGSASDVRKVIARTEGVLEEAAHAATVASLLGRIDEVLAPARVAASSEAARQAIEVRRRHLTNAADVGDERAFEDAVDDVATLTEDISSWLRIRIIDEPGRRSGILRQYDDTGPIVHYIMAEVVDASGEVVDFPFANREANGRISRTQVVAVQVDRELYDAVGDDKQADGVVDGRGSSGRSTSRFGVVEGRILGIKKPGTLETEWSIATYGTAVIEGE